MFGQYVELKDVQSTPGYQYRFFRPSSLSESFAQEPENIERALSCKFLETNGRGTPSDSHSIRVNPNTHPIKSSQPQPPPPPSPIFNNLFRFLFHITLISMFETLFFFIYVSTLEDTGIINTINGLVESTVQSCLPLNDSEKSIINDFLVLYINMNQTITDGNTAQQRRLDYNNILFNRAWFYVGSLGTLLAVFSTFIGIYYPRRIKWRELILENIGLVIMLALYEYMFFSTIILPYLPISAEEIERNIVYEFQNECGLLE